MRALTHPFILRPGRWAVLLVVSAFVAVVAHPTFVAVAHHAPPFAGEYVPRDIGELQQAVAPVALYPDALLAQVLAACTYPDDVIAATRWEDAGSSLQAIDAQPWDPSVKGVARYPSILHYMAANADWMNNLGDAFLNQQGDVMSAVQDLRGAALAAGTLTSTPQQTVIDEDGYIQIIPANPAIVYVPIYDPRVVYAPPAYIPGNRYPQYITYGIGVDVGDWLCFDLDWHDRAMYFGRWGRDRPWWHEHDRDRDPRDFHRYEDDRPGIYRPGQFRDNGGRPIQAEADHWKRDDHKPAPRVLNRPAPSRTSDRPERGFPPRTPAERAEKPRTTNVPTYGRGTDVSRQSDRGKASREKIATPTPPPRPPAPPPKPPPPPEPARVETKRAPVHQPTPPPEARPSAPVKGGAMGGYQKGEDASHSASRGSKSRSGH